MLDRYKINDKKSIMKKLSAICLSCLLLAGSAYAQNLLGEKGTYEYKTQKIMSMGATYMSGLVGEIRYSSGKVNGTITFNTKARFLKIADNKIVYKDEDLKTDRFPESCLIKGKGTVVGSEKTAEFQIIESYKSGDINILITWPDFSAARIQATFSKKK